MAELNDIATSNIKLMMNMKVELWSVSILIMLNLSITMLIADIIDWLDMGKHA